MELEERTCVDCGEIFTPKLSINQKCCATCVHIKLMEFLYMPTFGAPEICFRAWDEGNKVMHNDFEFIRSGTQGNDWIVFKSDKHPLSEEPHPFKNPFFAQQFKIMQFTGEIDMNGKKVFDGDILSGDVHETGEFEDRYKVVGEVRWDNTNVKWCLVEFGSGDVYDLHDYPWENVIGNIYQNPELMRD